MISFQVDWQVLVGLAVTMAIGFGVGCLVKRAGDSVGQLEPPSEGLREQWTKLVKQDTGGWWIGNLERPIFFAAVWLQAWVLLGAWLVMKTAFYWQGANFPAHPHAVPSAEELAYIAAKRRLGSHHVTTALVGTGANIVLALVGATIGKWLVLP